MELHSYKEFILYLAQLLMKEYWQPMWKLVKENHELVSVIPGFLINPEKIIFYVGRSHIGVEYIGPERLDELPETIHSEIEIQCFDYSLAECNLLDEIVGFYYGDNTFKLPLTPVTYDLILPTNAGYDELQRLNWNWDAQEFIVAFNSNGLFAPEGQFTRIVNGRFFDADKFGLKVRYIRWLDMIPCRYDDSGDKFDSFQFDLSVFSKLAQVDPKKPFPLPDDFRLERLQKINRFIELIGSSSIRERDITHALASDFKFIISMRFSVKEVFSEVLCEWQSATREAIQPDFFVVRPDGFADIVEFKLPHLQGCAVVGKSNREAFSSEINSYIAQTRVYREYFDDPRNRDNVRGKYGFEVFKPQRFLVMGRRWDLDNEDWRSIQADYLDLKIISYDDLVDSVIAQFYI